jgi:hypothetical protein
MNTVSTPHDVRRSERWFAAVGRVALRAGWHAVRLPILTLLALMEPLICRSLSMIALLGVLTAFFWEFVARPPHFPFWTVLGISVGVAMLQIPYYLLIRLFSIR